MPLSFTDDQIRDLTVLAAPLWPAARAEFLRALGAEFGDRAVIDDGELHRAAVRVQRDLLRSRQVASGWR
jgi:hypothetical protein